MAHSIDISIVIPACNEAECLEETIDRISNAFRGDVGLSWKIIVCDNASTDATSEAAKHAGARVVFEPQRGIARARNAGAQVAQGEWLLFVDADSYPSPELVNDVQTLLADPRIVGCGSTVKPTGGKWWMRLRLQRDNLLMRVLGLSAGVFILCRRDVFDAIGGFGNNLYALEELDFVIRLKWHGFFRGLSFRTLHRHPVSTSARTKGGLVAMLVSCVAARFCCCFTRCCRSDCASTADGSSSVSGTHAGVNVGTIRLH